MTDIETAIMIKNMAREAVRAATVKNVTPKIGSLMYDRGLHYTATTDYVPDFKNEQEKADWIAGVKAAREKKSTAKNGCARDNH